MQDRHIEEQCTRWVVWCWTRRLFAPPVKSNLLARLQVNRRGGSGEPDSFLDPDMPYFNMAVHALCDQVEHAPEAACFVGVHWYNCNIKALAREQQCARGTVYNRARAFARRALALSKTIRKVHESMTSERCSKAVEQNSSCVD